MKLQTILSICEADVEDDSDEFPVAQLRDLSKHKYNMFMMIASHEVNRVSDERWNRAYDACEKFDKDIITWHYWGHEEKWYEIHVTSDKSYQQCADATKEFRNLFPNANIKFAPTGPGNKIGHTRYDAREVKVKL